MNAKTKRRDPFVVSRKLVERSNHERLRRSTETASALMIVLWAVVLLASTVLGAVIYFNTTIDEERARNAAFRARLLAESGIALATHPLVEKDDPVLSQEMGPGESFEVAIMGEESRLNINTLAISRDRTILMDLFTSWNLTTQEASGVIDCIQDWVDADDLRKLDGAEREDYEKLNQPGYPHNQPFSSVEEVRAVHGMDLVAERKPDWQNYFTVYGKGQIDVNDAPADILQIVTRADPNLVELLVERRAGEDGEKGTEDDTPYKNLEEVRSMLGIDSKEFEKIAPWLTLRSSVRRIESTGKAGHYRKKIVAVVTGQQQGQPRILSWTEPPPDL